MAEHDKGSQQPRHGKGPSRHEGTQQHGWAPDVDETRQEENPSAHRSFHPEKHAPKPGPGPARSKESEEGVTGDTVESLSRRGEDQGGRSAEKGMHDEGPRGRAQRPSGSRDADAHTGVDPQGDQKESGSD